MFIQTLKEECLVDLYFKVLILKTIKPKTIFPNDDNVHHLKATKTKVFASILLLCNQNFKILMKRFLLFICIITLLWIALSCDKEDSTTDQLPGWLQLKITELVGDQKLCEMTEVTIIKYKGETYYHVYCLIWSCMYCQLFDENGNRPDWDSKQWDDFCANQKVVNKIPACRN
jgi:hypothetical protein